MKTKNLLLAVALMLGFSSSIFSQKWIVQHSGLPDSQNPTLVFSPVNSNVCWGIQYETNNPKCILTTDGGNNWKPVNLQGISGLTGLSSSCIFALNSETAWITLDDPVGTNGGIYKTTNGGTDWVKQESAFSGSGAYPRGIHFFDANNGLCVGNPRNGYWEVYTTTDGGTNWTQVPSSNIPLPLSGDRNFGGKAQGNSYCFGTIFRSLYRTTDKGMTWKVVQNVGNDVAFKDSLNGLSISYFDNKINTLYKTSDGGNTWTQTSTAPSYPSVYVITNVPGTSGTYIITSTSNIGFPEPTKPGSAYTLDDGEHWTVVDSLAHGQVTFTTGNVGWSAGSGDIIYKWVSVSPNDIVPVGSIVKKLSSDQLKWSKAVVWYNDSIVLFGEDLYANAPNIHQFNPISKQITLWPTNAPLCSGLTCDKDGNLIAASDNIIMLNKAGKVIKTLATGYNGHRFNNPIDLIADKKGGVYFCDPDFFQTPPPQNKTAVYYIDSTGNVKRVIDDLAEPNGPVLSPDGTKLYVVDTSNKYLYSWDVASDGSVSGKVTLAELQTKAGAANAGAVGQAIDIHGNIYVATEMGIQVFTPQGVAITTIAVPEMAIDCDFGGKDFKTLYITAYHGANPNFISNLYSIDLNYPGYAVSRLQDSPNDIVPVGATVKKLSTNQFGFLEGPVWYSDSVLLFVDDNLPGLSPDIYQYDPVGEKFSKWNTNATHCTGLSCDKDGNLIGASSNIIMMNKTDHKSNLLASTYNNKIFNNPNDLIADNKGGVYFTDPDFFLTTPPQDKTAVYYINSTGNVQRVIDDLAEPNGIILSPDGTKLYVDDTKNRYLYSWDVASDGSVSGKMILAELQFGVDSYADGMTVDTYGNIYVAGDIGIQVFSPQGAAIATIVVPEQPSNCDFGGKDFKTLYITAHSNLYSIDLNYPGYAVSRKGLPAAINSIPNKSLVKIYPNPVQDVLHFDLSEKTGMLEIVDITGKSLLQKEITEDNTSLDVSGLKTGIYFVKVRSDKQMFTGKFVKQ